MLTHLSYTPWQENAPPNLKKGCICIIIRVNLQKKKHRNSGAFFFCRRGSRDCTALTVCTDTKRRALSSTLYKQPSKPQKNSENNISLFFYFFDDSSMFSKAYLQHCNTNKLNETLLSAAVLFNFSNNGSVNRMVRAIFALLSSLSILNIFITLFF